MQFVQYSVQPEPGSQPRSRTLTAHGCPTDCFLCTATVIVLASPIFVCLGGGRGAGSNACASCSQGRGASPRDVVHQQSAGRTAIVRARNGAERLLASLREAKRNRSIAATGGGRTHGPSVRCSVATRANLFKLHSFFNWSGAGGGEGVHELSLAVFMRRTRNLCLFANRPNIARQQAAEVQI